MSDSAARELASNDAGVFTVPNLISLSRLLGVPFFFTAIVTHHHGWALLLLMYAGISDWADGTIARRFGQYSRLGEKLDPAADRLYIGFTLIGLAIVGLVSWWLVAIIVARDVVMIPYLAWLRRHDVDDLPVHYLGKAATMLLLYSFPILLLGEVFPRTFEVARAFGWAFGLSGMVLYWASGALYFSQRKQALAADAS